MHQLVHTKEKPHVCEFCDRSFSLKSNLKRHERVHRGERPYSCEICNKTFSEKRSMIIHTRTHTGEKPYSYVQISRQFPTAAILKVQIQNIGFGISLLNTRTIVYLQTKVMTTYLYYSDM